MIPVFVTYHSRTAEAYRQWICFICLNGEYLPVRFQGETEAAAYAAAQAEWERHKEVRERNIASREEGRRKADETRARKKEMDQ